MHQTKISTKTDISIKPFVYQIRILHFLSTVFAFDWSFRNFFYKKADKNSLKAKGLPVTLFQTCIKGNLLFRNPAQVELEPFHSQDLISNSRY